MKKLPSLLVVTDRGHFHAFEGHDDGSLIPLDNMDMDEGLKKLSEQVTDKAGGFPSAESGGHGNSAAERLPLVAELEMRTFRKIGQRIKELFDQKDFETGVSLPQPKSTMPSWMAWRPMSVASSPSI